jgi:potassium efflux system protein
MRLAPPPGWRLLRGASWALTLALAIAGEGAQAQDTASPPAATTEQGGAAGGATQTPAQDATGGTTQPTQQPVTGGAQTSGAVAVTTTTPATGANRPSTTVVVSKGSGKSNALDYAAWERAAERAETVLSNPDVEERLLETLRTQLVDWRAAFLVAQNTNSTRIASIRDQIAALGPVPAEGDTEAAEIAQRRQQLSDQLVRLQAPGITAEEAYRRADGLIGELDRVLRERQASQLLQLWPSPINPANWPAALTVMRDVTVRLWTETATRWTRGDGRRALFDNLPLIAVLVVLGMGMLSQGRRLVEPLRNRIPQPKTARGRRVVGLIFSLMQVLLPTLGALALSVAVLRTGLAGPLGSVLIEALPGLVFVLGAANWLGNAVFPVDPGGDAALSLATERRLEGRFLARMFGLLVAVEAVRNQIALEMGAEEAANAVLGFPVIATTAILLFRMGQLLRRHVHAEGTGDEGLNYGTRVLGLLARGVMLAGVAGLALGAIGYIAAATALVFPSVVSLGLVAVLFVLQRFVADIYGLITRSDAADQEGLIPVLIGFAMTLCSLPVLAVVWGARWADITELWQRFMEGFQIGATRVSPTDFLIFAIIFGAGYAVTRLLQGALKGTILPRTNLDQGGQNAVVSGVGYIGIFLAALIAINSAGIDLSGLAIVAGALSVGIGFGLQNIVSNFVSGIILLIERPVSEGDWIEVGNVSGTVRSISVRSTRIQTFDRSDVIVPNADLVTQRVTNWTRFNLSGRLVVPVNVVHGSDTRTVERILREIAEAQPLTILTPPPVIAFMGFTADGMTFEMRIILRDVNFSVQVRSEINHAIVRRFADAGIFMPGAPMADAAPEAAPAEPAEAADVPKARRAGAVPKKTESVDPTLLEEK